MQRTPIGTQEYLDMRQTRWELYQPVREIPVVSRGLVVDTVVIPKHLLMMQVQARLDYRAPYPYLWTLVALDHDNWVITVRDLSASIQFAMDSLERLRTGELRVRRAGMWGHHEDASHAQEAPQVHSVWTRGICQDFVVAWVMHAHMENKCEPYIAMMSATALDLLKKIAQKHSQNLSDMRLTTHRRVIEPNELLVDLVRCPLVVHWVALMARHDYNTRFIIDWWVREDSDTMPTSRRPVLILPSNQHVFSVDVVDGVEEWTLDCPPRVPRAGAKSSKYRSHEPKAVMHTWALEKIERELPHFSQSTASFLLKAEARTVSATLHAKSSAQLEQVLQAAMKRADINAQKDKDEPTQAASAGEIKSAQQLIINQLSAMAENVAIKTDLNELFQQIQVQQLMIMQHLQVLTNKVNELEHACHTGSTSQQCPATPQLTPMYPQQAHITPQRTASRSSSLTPTVVASQPASHEEDQPTQEYQDMESEKMPVSPLRSILQQLRANSLMAQSQRTQKVALRPFGVPKGL